MGWEFSKHGKTKKLIQWSIVCVNENTYKHIRNNLVEMQLVKIAMEKRSLQDILNSDILQQLGGQAYMLYHVQ